MCTCVKLCVYSFALYKYCLRVSIVCQVADVCLSCPRHGSRRQDPFVNVNIIGSFFPLCCTYMYTSCGSKFRLFVPSHQVFMFLDFISLRFMLMFDHDAQSNVSSFLCILSSGKAGNTKKIIKSVHASQTQSVRSSLISVHLGQTLTVP